VHEGDAVRVTWRDATDNEVGYRIDRRIDGGRWIAIAYRPPQIAGDENNRPEWIDFLAPSARPVDYRVVALSGKDNDDGASAPTQTVTLAKPSHPSQFLSQPPKL
jgi:hypothetical protein